MDYWIAHGLELIYRTRCPRITPSGSPLDLEPDLEQDLTQCCQM